MNYNELIPSEQPVNRVRELGAQAVTIEELFSVSLYIKNRDVTEKLSEVYHKRGGLSNITEQDLIDIQGVGKGVVSAIKAIIEFGRREQKSELDQYSIHSPTDIANMVQYEMGALDHEELWVVLLNTRNKVIQMDKVYKGCLNSCTVRVGELFKKAIVNSAAAVVICHNHPSGDPTPSPDDIALTRAIKECGKLMDIEVLDHLIIGRGKFVSMKERGLGF